MVSLLGEIDLHRQGYGIEAMRLLLRYAFSTLNLRKVTAHAYADNTASVALHQKLGYVEEGRLMQEAYIQGKLRDEVILSVFKERFETIDKR